MLCDLVPLLSQRSLTAEEVGLALRELFAVGGDEKAKGEFLTAWAQRGETAEELAFCAEALLPQARDPGLRGSYRGKPLLDCCGTGGGGLNLFNVSTGLMFVLAARGIPVVKHGNRGMTKKSGSADVLETLGIRIDLPPEKAEKCLAEIGCTFLFAPAYHLGFSAIQSVRRQLSGKGQRTVFNLLGPLLNPARPEARLVGVFKKEHVPLYHDALRQMGCPRFTIACGEDKASGLALGEVSASGPTNVAGTVDSLPGEMLKAIHPHEKIETLLVPDAPASARFLVRIFSGEEQGPGRELLTLNAAVAALTQGRVASLEEGLALAAEAIDSGRAQNVLERWREFSGKI